MIQTQDVDLARLIREVREEVAARRAGTIEAAAPPLDLPALEAAAAGFERIGVDAPPIEMREAYALAELVALHDEDFVHNAYRALLRREPDPSGGAYTLWALRSGRMSKVEILARIAASPEGRGAKVRVRGLALAERLRRLQHAPVVGPLFRVLVSLLRLPGIVASLERHEAQLFQREREMRIAFNAHVAAAEAAIRERTRAAADSIRALGDAAQRLHRDKAPRSLAVSLAGRVVRLRFDSERTAEGLAVVARGQRRIDALEAALPILERVRVEAEALARRLGAAENELQLKAGREQMQELFAGANAALDALRLETRAMSLRLGATEAQLDRKADAETVAGLAETSRVLRAEVLGEDGLSLDDFYVKFEDRFRGPPELIRERVAIYAPIVRSAGAGTLEAPVLDIGCGRGEWLLHLKELGLVGRGVDINAEMVRQCREQGLEVDEADALEHLGGLDEGSLGAVTGLHVIEHLPFRRRIMLIDAILRVLRPGGIAILETPNPENLQVGACNFWNDPTHVAPLPPEATRVTVEMRGFAAVEVLPLHPYPVSEHLPPGRALRDELNHLLNGPQDYAIVARKA